MDLEQFSYSIVIAALEDDRDGLARLLASTPPVECAATSELALMTMAKFVTHVLPPEYLSPLIDQIRTMALDHAQFNQIVENLEGN